MEKMKVIIHTYLTRLKGLTEATFVKDFAQPCGI
jgi:hypothetical protein